MPQGYHHVTQEERCQIYALKSIVMSLRGIARELGRDVTTISKELKRNSEKRRYRYKQAHQKGKAQTARSKSAAEQNDTPTDLNC